MRFAHPWLIVAALLLPVAGLFLLRGRSKSASMLFSDISSFKSIGPTARIRMRHLPAALRAVFLAALVAVLMRPQSELKSEVIFTEGIDIMLALDVSGSMRAEDFKPNNRLFVAKQVIGDFVKGMKDNRLGLVVFAGKSFTQCPLTMDYGTLLNFLQDIDFGIVEDGTAIGTALATATSRLKDSKAKSKVIVQLTDGVNNAGFIDPETAAKLANTYDIKVYTIGVGKEGGAPIPIMDPIMGKTYARNPDGSIQMTEIDEDTLTEISRITHGRYFRATDADKLKEIYREIARLEKSKIESREFRRYKEYFQWILAPACALFLFELGLSTTIFRKLP